MGDRCGGSSSSDEGFLHEEGTPLSGGLAIIGRAAAEFVKAVEVADEFGLAPTGDVFVALAEKEIGDVEALNR